MNTKSTFKYCFIESNTGTWTVFVIFRPYFLFYLNGEGDAEVVRASGGCAALTGTHGNRSGDRA